MSNTPQKALHAAVTLTFCAFLAAVMAVSAFMFNGCAASNLTGPAKTHQQITLLIADDCTLANQAKLQYTAGKIPQTETARTAINDAGAACEQAKFAFMLVLTAEQQYRVAQAVQVTNCTPQTGLPVETPACEASAKNTDAAKLKVDNANADLDTKLSTMTAKAAVVKPLIQKQ